MELIARGSDADVFALEDAWVLRRYRAGGDAVPEAALMAHVAAHGYPVPAVRSACGPDLVLERVHGPTLWGAIAEGTVSARDGGRLLRWLHSALHGIPAPRRAQERIVHLDLHPDNVLISEAGPQVIDWRNARQGPAAMDVALSALIVAQVTTCTDDRRATSASDLLAEFLRPRAQEVVAGLPDALAFRRADPNIPDSEKAGLDHLAATIGLMAGPVRSGSGSLSSKSGRDR